MSVAASAAIPVVFENVHVPGSHGHANPFMDGGVVDRVGLKSWRRKRRDQAAAWRQSSVPTSSSSSMQQPSSGDKGKEEEEEALLPPCLVHVIERSSTFSGDDDVEASGEPRVHVVRSPKSGVSLLSLGDFDGAWEAARERARPAAMEVKQQAMASSRLSL